MDTFIEVEQPIEFSKMIEPSIKKLVLNTSLIRTIQCAEDGKAIIELDSRTIRTNENYQELCRFFAVKWNA